ncbi:phage tail fiber protein [Salmonella enterica subsp. enterica serovar Gatineau]|uniref:phage tail fiber domain-containing protein n=1 Tax=Salmonella enterica TaxID=28901 RepID=UPI00285AB889|nr:phage tail fiber protein [Salmonella enterica]MDR7936688.1 phage tail fiber protein [Salmonella enterica subsp. enterica serovar Gatineau]
MKSIYKPVAPYTAYLANGSTTSFTYNFLLLYAEDLSVYIDQELQTTGYTIDGVFSETGGTVTFLTPPAKGKKVYLVRLVQLYRIIEYQDNGDLLADTVNNDFDRIWQVLTQGYWALQFCMRRSPWGGPWEGQGFRISDIADPIDDQDAVTKKYAEEHYNMNRWRADWSATTAYYAHDGVHCDGSSWYCEHDNTGIRPGSDTYYWTMMAQKGDKGDKGDQGVADAQATFKTAIKLDGSLNNYITPGLYYNDDIAQATSANVYPEKNIEGEMEVYYIDPNGVDVVQKFTSSKNNYYGRVCWGGAWSAWLRFATSADLANYYTKTEIDNKFKNYYTKSEVDALISGGSSGGGGGSGSIPAPGEVGTYALVTGINVQNGWASYGTTFSGDSLSFASFTRGDSGYFEMMRTSSPTPSGKWTFLANYSDGDFSNSGVVLAMRVE